jgi:hypothetical protein
MQDDETNETIVQEIMEDFCKCGKLALPLHPCPYKADVNDDSETLCNCCEKCMGNCADDT